MRSPFSKLALYSGVLILASGIVLLRIILSSHELPIGKQIQLRGEIREEPRVIGQSQYFKLDGVFVRTTRFPEFHFGDRLLVGGFLEEEGRLFFPRIEKIGVSDGVFPTIFNIRKKLVEVSQTIWSEPISSLISGVVLGNNFFTQDFLENLRKTGTLHIVVVSGQNVTILAGFIFLLIKKFPRKVVIGLIIGLVFFYAVLSGLQPPAVRAAIMGSLAFGAQLFGRENFSLWGLLLAAYIMIFISPDLVSDISFQLSFSATLGILILSPIFKGFTKLPKFLNESLVVTLSAWVFTAPLLAYYFSQFTPITPISNLLVLPLVPAIMILGATSIVLGALFIPVGQIFGFLASAPALIATIVIEKISLIPLATIPISFPLFLVFVYYLILVGFILLRRKPRA